MKNFFQILLLVLITQILTAQDKSELNMFKLGQSFERAGQYEKAREIFEKLYARRPGNRVYLEALIRVNVQLKDYDKAVKLARGWLNLHPDDATMMALLGDIYFKSGKKEDAFKMWENTIKLHKDNVGLYRIVADYLIKNHLYEKAIEYLQRGRRVSRSPTLYAYEIALLYSFMMKFDKATEEYVRILKDNPGLLGIVQQRMAGYTGKPDGLSSAISVLENAARRYAKNFAILKLYAWLLIEGKIYDKAFEIYRKIDKVSSGGGGELFKFAKQMMSEGVYEYALMAYDEIVENYPGSSLVPEARLGYARAFESILRARLTKSQRTPELLSKFKELEDLYKGIAVKYKGTLVEARALFRLGLLKLEIYFDVDESEKIFKDIERKFGRSSIGVEAMFKLAEVYILKDELDRAREKYRHILSLKITHDTLRVKFLLAQIDYYEGNFDNALKILKGISSATRSNYSNDAIELMLRIQMGISIGDELLKMFARAELLKRQGRYNEAIALLEDMRLKCGYCQLGEDILFKLSELYRHIGKPRVAVAILDTLLSEYGNGVLVDDAVMRKAEIYLDELGDREVALKIYEKLLRDFPNSIYRNEARKKIRRLRGEN